MLSLSLANNVEILKYQCNKFNNKLNIVDEAYTTKTCSNCNEINDIGSSKNDYKKCDFTCDRDINASINIFKK